MANAITTDTHACGNDLDTRSTFEILKSCGGTIFLLCWCSVCPTIPGPERGRRRQWRMKLCLFGLAILGPDFIFMSALGQLNTAWRMRNKIRAQVGRAWSLKQCFLVNMGGVHIKFSDKATTFPVDCGQLLYLAQRKHIREFPDIPEEEIEDRNKGDELARAITIVQTLWFTSMSFCRVTQGLHLTTLELTTLAFIILMVACSICWWRKPMDISQPVRIIQATSTLSEVIDQHASSPEYAAVPSPNLGRTPLAFLTRREWFLSQFWAYYSQIIRRIFRRQQSPAGQATSFPSIEFQETDVKWEILFGPWITIYSCVFVAAWNFHFPTELERDLWRASSIINLAYGALGSLLAWIWHNRVLVRNSLSKVLPLHRPHPTQAQTTSTNNGRTQPESASAKVSIWHGVSKRFDFLRNLSPEGDPELAVPMRLQVLTTTLCIAYCFSRAYILVEDLIALRDLPPSAYQTVNWERYSPLL